ncbi:lytic transglycosylase domain-containing protein [Megasphaera sp.]|uniref:lytic transglycosylase domain-containing protein n=1 Tax=Megasphaera sp. TaxID=2023260 RepID=UPI0025DF7448|nr:lytic transglycosylase domain-containing protein [uncultured Megasphaera sp.]
MLLGKACRAKVAALLIGVMAVLPVQAITQEEMVYDQVNKYVHGSEAAAIAQDICDASYLYGVDPILVAAVFTTESHFDNSAVSGVGAVGISQLMPSTAASLNINPYNRRENIYGGVKYLGQMVERYRSWDKPFVYAEAAYNAGPGAVDRAGGVPHYAETMNYVQTVEQTRREIWRLAGHEAMASQQRVVTKKTEAPIFPSLKEWHEQHSKAAKTVNTAVSTAARTPVKLAQTAEKTRPAARTQRVQTWTDSLPWQQPARR